jgi:hypothetical protein
MAEIDMVSCSEDMSSRSMQTEIPSSDVLLVNGDKIECSCCKMILTSLTESRNLLGVIFRHDDEPIK